MAIPCSAISTGGDRRDFWLSGRRNNKKEFFPLGRRGEKERGKRKICERERERLGGLQWWIMVTDMKKKKGEKRKGKGEELEKDYKRGKRKTKEGGKNWK